MQDLQSSVRPVRWEPGLQRSPLLASARRLVVVPLASALLRGWLGLGSMPLWASALKRGRTTPSRMVLVLRWAVLAQAWQVQRRVRPRYPQARRLQAQQRQVQQRQVQQLVRRRLVRRQALTARALKPRALEPQ